MAKAKKSSKGKSAKKTKQRRSLLRRALRGIVLLSLLCVVLMGLLILLFSVVNPPITHTMIMEKRRLVTIDRHWVDIEDIAPVMVRSAVAAEDANFCLHWGFDVEAIRAALAEGGQRGGSTISQQVVKNVFLWQGRSWIRKVLEAAITPAVEAVWSKRRILEVYLNVAETGKGLFGVEAAARRYFAVPAIYLDAQQAARIAAILPSPRSWSATEPTAFVQRRTVSIVDGAATIAADGRSECFED